MKKKMKKNKLLLTLVVGAIFGMIFCAGIIYAQGNYTENYVENDGITRVIDTATKNDTRAISVKITTTLPPEPEQLPIYYVIDVSVDKDKAISIAKKFNFDVGPKIIAYPVQPEKALSPLKTKYLFKNEPYYLEIDTSSNAITYANKDKMMKISDNLPSESDAIKIAQNFLKRYGISINNATIETETIYLNKLDTSTNEILDKQPMMVQVRFKRNVDGMSVVGPGGKIIVAIGDDDEPVYFFKNWRTIESVGAADIIPLSAAIEKLKRLEVKDVPVTPLNSIEVIGIKIGYYEDIPSEEQTNYKPVWVFDVKTPASTETIQLCVDATI